VPAKSDNKHPKTRTLLEEGTLNPAPEKVHDPKFLDSEFFDPHDIVQVKYEMLRRVSVENASVTNATGVYGVSRPTYYQTKASFDESGIAGLVPKKRGPRGPHKLQGEVLAFIQGQLVARPRAATRGSRRAHAFPVSRHVGLGTGHGYDWREHVTAAELLGVELRTLG